MQNIQKYKKTSRERTNLTIKDYGILKNKRGDYSDTELTIIFCFIHFSIDLDASKSGKVYPAIHRSGWWVLLKAPAVVKQLINECSSSRLKDEFETFKKRTYPNATRKKF